MPKTNGTWEGGFIFEDSKGRRTYYIKRRVNGERYEISTRCHTLKAALAQLQRFEASPESYDPAGVPTRAALLLTDDLVREHLEWCRDVKGNSSHWLNNKRLYLAWWIEKLDGVDLRRASLADHIKPALAGATGRAHRIATLKHLFAWLRKEKHALTLAEDPTVGMLPVPQARPAQWTRSKVIPVEHYEKARKHLTGHWRDAIDLQAGTGWHVTEVARFARDGAVDVYAGTSRGVGGVVICPRTKAGDSLRTAVSARVLAAAKRLREHGSLAVTKYHLAVKRACLAADVPPFGPGQFRHSVATWAVNRGADPAQVAAFLNHKSPATTRRFYATLATPAKVPTLR